MRTIILLILMLVAVIFAVQNADRVAVDVLFWRLDASLAIVIALCVATGVLVGVLITVPRIYRMRADQRRCAHNWRDSMPPGHPSKRTRPSKRL